MNAYFRWAKGIGNNMDNCPEFREGFCAISVKANFQFQMLKEIIENNILKKLDPK